MSAKSFNKNNSRTETKKKNKSRARLKSCEERTRNRTPVRWKSVENLEKIWNKENRRTSTIVCLASYTFNETIQECDCINTPGIVQALFFPPVLSWMFGFAVCFFDPTDPVAQLRNPLGDQFSSSSGKAKQQSVYIRVRELRASIRR